MQKMFKVGWSELYEVLVIAKNEEDATDKAMNMEVLPIDIPSSLMTIEEVKNVSKLRQQDKSASV